MNQFLSDFLNTLLLALAPVAATALAGWLITLWKKATTDLQTKHSQLYEQILWFAGIAVRAAEQAGLAYIIEDKKTFAIDYLETLVSKYLKIDLELDEAANIIETAVWDEFNQLRY
jgi:hypothetical protein